MLRVDIVPRTAPLQSRFGCEHSSNPVLYAGIQFCYTRVLEGSSLLLSANSWRMRLTLRAVIGFFLAVLLALPVPGWSQSNLVAPGGGLKIVVIRGEGVVNSITSKGAPVVVEVRDDTDKPLAGADVVFQMPYMGPGGTFYGWMRTHSTRTDAEGRATSASFSPSSEE